MHKHQNWLLALQNPFQRLHLCELSFRRKLRSLFPFQQGKEADRVPVKAPPNGGWILLQGLRGLH